MNNNRCKSLPIRITTQIGKVQALVFLFISLTYNVIQAQKINTVVGDGIQGSTGNGGHALNAEIDRPVEILFDKAGNLYVAEPNYNQIRRVSKSGIISQFAGTGVQGFSGDGGPAMLAQFYFPSSLNIDDAGNIYIMDAGNYRLRKINTLGIISTIAGNGIASNTGDGGPADSAGIDCGGIHVDDSGNIYIAQSYQNNIRKINKAGIISTVAGNGKMGYSGDGGPATAAEFNTPDDITSDSKGNIYIIDVGNNCVREVDKSGIIKTIAGNGIMGYFGDGGPADSAELSNPQGVMLDAKGNIYISDYGNNCIREITALNGFIQTIAGNGIMGYSGDGGLADSAELNNPVATGLDSSGNLYIADYNNYVIRKVSKDSITGINQLFVNTKANIFPNPNNGVFTIIASGIRSKSLVEIYNTIGEKIYTGNLNASITKIDLSNNADGIYLYRVVTETGGLVSTGKIMIQK
jgi:hypothetical protein